MIPRDYITEWRDHAPWVQDFQVEQDLVISRALIAIFTHPVLADALAFRGGTALYKLHIHLQTSHSSAGPLFRRHAAANAQAQGGNQFEGAFYGVRIHSTAIQRHLALV